MVEWLFYLRVLSHFDLLALVGLALLAGAAVGFCIRGLLEW